MCLSHPVYGRIRNRLIEVLAAQGPIESDEGRAVPILAELMGYARPPHSLTGTIRILADLSVIVRDVRGKRTYFLAVAP